MAGARLLSSDGILKSNQIHDLSFDPVPDMDKRILQVLGQLIQLEPQMSFVVSRHELGLLNAAYVDSGLSTGVLVLMEEVGKLLVEPKLLRLHGHYLLDMSLEFT